MQPGYSFLELQRISSALFPNRRTALEPFAHVLDFENMAADETVIQSYKVLSNCDFLLTNLVFSYINVDIPASPVYVPASSVDIQIEDTGTQEKIFYQSVPLISVAETAAVFDGFCLNMIMPVPKRIAGNSTLQFTINNGPIENTTLQFVLHGVNIYAYS